MLRIAVAEARYHVWSIAFWLALAVAIVLGSLALGLGDAFWIPRAGGGVGAWMARGMVAQSLLTGVAFVFLFLPIAAAGSTFRMLGTETSEGRWRLLGSLPLSQARLAAARLLRAMVVPLGTMALALPLLLTAAILDPYRLVDALRHEPWVLPSLLLLSISIALLITLLHDLTSPSIAQAIAVGVAIPLALAVLDPGFRVWLQPGLGLMPTAAGPLWLLVACGLFAALDIAVVALRPGAGRVAPTRSSG